MESITSKKSKVAENLKERDALARKSIVKKLIERRTYIEDKEAEYRKYNEILEGIKVFLDYTKHFSDVADSKQRMNLVGQKYRNFLKKHVVVCDFMISKNVYNVDAYIKYITRLYDKDNKGPDHYNKCQAAYYRYLSEELGANKDIIKKREKEIFNDLQKNMKNQEELSKNIKEEYQKLDKKYTEERRSMMKDLLVNEIRSWNKQ
jgi:hypothetical protein